MGIPWIYFKRRSGKELNQSHVLVPLEPGRSRLPIGARCEKHRPSPKLGPIPSPFCPCVKPSRVECEWTFRPSNSHRQNRKCNWRKEEETTNQCQHQLRPAAWSSVCTQQNHKRCGFQRLNKIRDFASVVALTFQPQFQIRP